MSSRPIDIEIMWKIPTDIQTKRLVVKTTASSRKIAFLVAINSFMQNKNIPKEADIVSIQEIPIVKSNRVELRVKR